MLVIEVNGSIIILFESFFPISVSWWSFNGRFSSSGYFWIICLILSMAWSAGFRCFLWFSIAQVFSPRLIQDYQLLLVLPSPSCSTAFLWQFSSIGSLNIHGTYVIVNYSTNNNVVFFFVSDLKIVYYNNYQFSISIPLTREERIFCVTTYLETKIIQNCASKILQKVYQLSLEKPNLSFGKYFQSQGQ